MLKKGIFKENLSCKFCQSIFTCPQAIIELVSDRMLEQPEYITDLRAFTSRLPIAADHWVDYLVDLYRDYNGIIVSNGKEVFLNTEIFEQESIREWFRDWACVPVRKGVRPRLRNESCERIRVLATILTARFPADARLWGLRAANDNHPPNNNERYPPRQRSPLCDE